MFDPHAPSTVSALRELAAPGARAALLRVALVLSPVRADAEDLLAEAIVLVSDPDARPWEPERAPFMTHMRVVLRDLARQERRRVRAQRETLSDDPGGDHPPADPGPGPADLLVDAEDVAQLADRGARLRARLASDPLVLAVFDLACAGVESASDVAERVGCALEDVYNARRRLVRQAAAVRDEEGRGARPARRRELQTTEAP